MLDADDPEGEWRVRRPAARRRRVRRRAGRRPAPRRAQHRQPRRRPRVGAARRDEPRAVGPVAPLGGGRAVRRRSTRSTARPCSRSAPAGSPRCGCCPDGGADPSGHGEAWDVVVDQAVHSIGLGDNPEPAQTAIQVVVESWATPRTVLDVDLASRESTVLKRQPVLGDFDPANYTEHREWATAPDGTRVPVSVVHRVGVEPDGTQPGSRHGIRVLRDLLRPLLLRGAAQPARPGGRLRRGPRARWRRDGASLVRRGQAAQQAEHLHRHPRGGGPPRRERVGSHPTAWGSRAVLPVGSWWVRSSTWPPSGSGWRTPRCRSSTR